MEFFTGIWAGKSAEKAANQNLRQRLPVKIFVKSIAAAGHAVSCDAIRLMQNK